MLINILLPVFLVAGSGYGIGRLLRLDSQPLTKIVFYLLTPALIFHSIYARRFVGGEVGTVILFVIILHLTLITLGMIGTRIMRLDEDLRIATTLSLSFNNVGNYGLPLLLFAFGEPGLVLGIIYMVSQITIQATLGVGLAVWSKGRSLLTFITALLSVPWVYAFIIALLLRTTAVIIPAWLIRPIELLAQAAIPIQLLVLGVELSWVKIGSLFRLAVPIALTKVIIPPLLAWGLTAALGIEGLLRAVLIIQASTPTAVNTLILTLRYNRRADLVAAIVLLTTVGSLITIGILLSLLL
ncbi:AEC family transporter [Candidatus Acetothermia bacterium]|nr:AEC family transporter [Candidatus Acetothermia bacterium]